MPMTPFIGVRISWLMLARNWLFALFAAAAVSVASSSAKRVLLALRDVALRARHGQRCPRRCAPGRRARGTSAARPHESWRALPRRQAHRSRMLRSIASRKRAASSGCRISKNFCPVAHEFVLLKAEHFREMLRHPNLAARNIHFPESVIGAARGALQSRIGGAQLILGELALATRA